MTRKEELVSELFYDGLISEEEADILLEKDIIVGSMAQPEYASDITDGYIAVVYSLN